MTPTKATTLLIATLISAVASYLTATYLLTHGYPIPVSGYNLMFTLPAIAVILALLALPLWRYRRQNLKLAKLKTESIEKQTPQVKRVDPFYAVRILVLAKATSVAGSLFTGWHLALIFIQASGPELTSGFFKNLVTLIGAILAVAIALIIEWICRIPDSPDKVEKTQKTQGKIDPQLSKELHD